MSTKFGLGIDFNFRMRVTSSNTTPEVVLSHRCRHLEIVHDVIIPPLADLDEIWYLMQNNTPITMVWSKLQPEEKFQYGGRLFSKTEVVIISALN